MTADSVENGSRSFGNARIGLALGGREPSTGGGGGPESRGGY